MFDVIQPNSVSFSEHYSHRVAYAGISTKEYVIGLCVVAMLFHVWGCKRWLEAHIKRAQPWILRLLEAYRAL